MGRRSVGACYCLGWRKSGRLRASVTLSIDFVYGVGILVESVEFSGKKEG
jgi:hypothetical protein